MHGTQKSIENCNLKKEKDRTNLECADIVKSEYFEEENQNNESNINFQKVCQAKSSEYQEENRPTQLNYFNNFTLYKDFKLENNYENLLHKKLNTNELDEESKYKHVNKNDLESINNKTNEVDSKCSAYNQNIKTNEKIQIKKLPVCDICRKTFTHKLHLIQHERIHRKEKPYICETCGQAFTQKSHLKRHKKIHLGKKPYVCETCNKSFK